MSAASTDSAVAIDPAWVASDPQLTRLLGGATPACAIKETFLADRDGSVAHSYEVYAPALDQAELEKRFRDAAQTLGYAVTRQPLLGLGFQDEAKQRSGAIYDARVSVLFARVASANESAQKLATKMSFETWTLIEALGGKWTMMAIQRSAGDAATLEAELTLAPAKRPALEAWTRDKKLEPDGQAWMRKSRKDAPQLPLIFIEAGKDGKLFILETRGEPLGGPACRVHPTHKEHPDAGPPSKSKPSKTPTDDDLIREMMGK